MVEQTKYIGDIEAFEKLSYYWEDVRKYYQDFESGMMSPHTEIYVHEMPGGQYSNLQQQAKAVGLGESWEEVKKMYSRVNLLFGDIVKVTPSSKVVGDMALFMVQNNLDEDICHYNEEKQLTSQIPLLSFSKDILDNHMVVSRKNLQKVILKDREAITVRPGELLEPVDFEAVREKLFNKLGRPVTSQEILSLYSISKSI